MRRIPLFLAFVAALAVASPASAAPRWQSETLPFGDVPAREADASVAVAPDGRAVFARFAPDGALEVRERPPGEPIGPVITLPPVTVAPQPLPNLQLLVGADGTAAVLFDAGAIRYAAMRAPGGRWTDPEPVSPSRVGPGQAAIGPDGELWIVATSPADADALAVFRMTPGHAAQPASFPAPRTGARDLAPALVAPAAGSAHVIYLERGTTAAATGCATRTAVVAVDVPAYGDPLPPRRLDAFDATGTGTAEACQLTEGQVVLRPLLLAADATGADTAVYSVVSLDPFTATPLARHRDRGGTWPVEALEPAEPVSAAGVVAEKLIGGPGSPLVVLRGAGGKSIASRAAGRWTSREPLFDDVGSYDAARTGVGTTVFAWAEATSPERILARVADAGGVLGDPVELSATGATLLAVGGDDRGDATALYTRPRGDGFVLAARDYGELEPPIAEPPPVIPEVTPEPTPTIEPSTPPPAADTRAPLVGRVSVNPRRLHAGRPAALLLSTDEAGSAELTLTKLASGVRSGGRCVQRLGHRGPRCTRTLARRVVSLPLSPGANRVALPRLSAGTWTVTVVVADGAGNRSRPPALHLHVLR